MEDANKKYLDERQDKLKAQEDAQRLRQQMEDLREKYRLARDQFVSSLTKTIKDAGQPLPGSEPGKPVQITPAVLNQTIIPRARRIVDERDHARDGINRVSKDLDEMSNAMDSAIDDVKQILDNPPVDPQKLLDAIKKVSDSWDAKLKLIDALAQTSIQALGCPVLTANIP